MDKKEKILFEKLKKEITRTFLLENTTLSEDISQWRGEEIVKFQEDLLNKVKGRVSEKWFYNYFRNTPEKLPRIDMLNLLSKYAGYENWADFRNKNSSSVKLKSLKKIYWISGILFLSILLAWNLTDLTDKPRQIKLCFVDENLNPVNETVIIKVYDPEERVFRSPPENSCLSFETPHDSVSVEIKSAYYLPKKIVLHTRENTQRKIMLLTDVNALIFRRYSNKPKTDKKKIQKRLENLIADDAIIYQQWFGEDKGIEIYSKEEFIAQLLTPTSLVKHIEILDKKYKNGKIYRLRFSVKN